MSLGFLAWLPLTYGDLHDAEDRARTRMAELRDLRSRIVYLDEVLTMSARMAAATGDPQWETRYWHHEPLLGAAIARARELAPLDARRTDEANDVLVAIEGRVFEAVRAGRLERAAELLASATYAENKQSYATGAAELSRSLGEVHNRLHSDFSALESRTGWFVVMGLAGLLAAWTAVVWSLLRSRAQLLRENEARERAERALRRAGEAKTRFLANMSHEIRTPMTAILGYADEMLEGGDLTRIPRERLRAVNAIRRSGRHLLQIINDILDFSKIEAGEMRVESIPWSPVQLLADVLSIMSVQARDKGLALSLEYPAPVPVSVEGDPMRVRQVLLNLVGNAIKFTPSGSVRIVTSFIEAGSASVLQFAIVDTGVGISEEVRSRLFDPFSQADSSTTRNFGGTGLGLSISRRLVDLMGGTVALESELSVGSTFTVSLPVAFGGAALVRDPSLSEEVRNESELPCEPLPSIDGRILLVEDSPDNQRLIRRILERAGAVVDVADNGRIALEAVRESGDAFDLILMDMQMPILDGYDTTRALRQSNYDKPIIALTAHAMADERDRCLRVGCDEFASKPIDKPVLLELIARHIASEGKPA